MVTLCRVPLKHAWHPRYCVTYTHNHTYPYPKGLIMHVTVFAPHGVTAHQPLPPALTTVNNMYETAAASPADLSPMKADWLLLRKLSSACDRWDFLPPVNLPAKKTDQCQRQYWRNGQKEEGKEERVRGSRRRGGVEGERGREVVVTEIKRENEMKGSENQEQKGNEAVSKSRKKSEKQQGESVWWVNSQKSTRLWLVTGGNLLMRSIL